ncbi:MAG: peptidylprolyl isomerase [Phycisphaeraceae bacterium]|nr:peptidylprolyl isomerase [Phycisphaerales bacterium]MCB9860124.1 peptidylprolyl isomerase [Phycisphaeraceae bacterium]
MRNRENHNETGFLFENLEQRMLLSSQPAFPNISDLANPLNSVVRMYTDFGVIDIEMYDVSGPSGGSAAPNTVANFVQNYVNEGNFERSFFHRIVGGFVLQGGGFIFDNDAGGLSAVPTASPVVNEFNADRSNIARTIAMAKIGGDPNSATSQFFFNLSDNSPNLNNQNGGFTVFGRVANTSSWNVVTTIASLADINFVTSNPVSTALTDVPVKSNYTSGAPLNEDFLVDLIDVELIKPSGTNTFFDYRLVYPEGYAAGDKTNTIYVANGDSTNAAFYQVIARYESQTKRDRVLASGSIVANGFAEIDISSATTTDVVVENAPFAIEIITTTEMGATFRHEDYGAVAVEDFINVTDLAGAELQTWEFGGVGLTSTTTSNPSVDLKPYLLLQNLSSSTATVTIEMTKPDLTKVTYFQTLEPFRRGGLELFNIVELTQGIASLRVTANQEIAAAMSAYDVRTSNGVLPVVSRGAWTAAGVANGADTNGSIAGVRGLIGNETYMSFQNRPNVSGVAIITHKVTGNPVAVNLTNITMTPNARGIYDLRDITTPATQFTTLNYTLAGVGRASAHYVGTASTLGDQLGAALDTRASSVRVFSGGGFTTGGTEVLSVYNPDTGEDIDISVSFVFADGTKITLPFQTITAGDRTDIDVSTLTNVLTKISSGSQFANYGIVVSGVQGTDVGPMVASLTSIDATGQSAALSTGTMFGQAFYLDSGRFGPGSVT